MRNAFVGSLVFGCLTACRSYPEGSGTLEGTIDGQQVPVSDAIFTRQDGDGGFLDTGLFSSGPPTRMLIKLTSFGGACGVANDQILYPGASFLTIAIERRGAAEVLPPPGTYSVKAGPDDGYAVVGYFTRLDETCEATRSPEAVILDGSVTITSSSWDLDQSGRITGGDLEATYALVIQGEIEEQHVSGSIHAVACAYGWYIGGGAECVPPEAE